jgi:trk system potassium uptake protein
MRVVILGGGAVGTLVARRLVNEGNEVTIVEKSEERCAQLDSELDARIVQGSASSIRAMEKASMGGADMLIAVTSSDEANLLGCLIAQSLGNVRIKVARLRTHEVDAWRPICGDEFLKIDLIIHPDRETANQILPVLGLPNVSNIFEFANGRVQLFGVNIERNTRLVGKTLAELNPSAPPYHTVIAMIFRAGRVIIPRGNERLRAGDQLYAIAPAERLEQSLSFLGAGETREVQRVFVLGGKQLGIEVALQLEQRGVHVKLFEKDYGRCQKIAAVVRDTVVIHGDGTDQRLLEEENAEDIDAYLALTGDDEVNIIAALLGKRMGAHKAVALVNRLDILPMAQLLGISSIFSSRLSVVDRILQFVRKGHVLSVTTFQEEQAEAIELVAGPHSKYVGKPLKDVRFPKDTLVGSIVRPSGEVVVPRGDTVIYPGDDVVFFSLEQTIPLLESAFLAETVRGR